MQRRGFIQLPMGLALLALQRAHAQQAVPTVGFLNSASPIAFAIEASAFRQGLKETGYIEGQNVKIEYRWAENHRDRLPALSLSWLAAT